MLILNISEDNMVNIENIVGRGLARISLTHDL
jgi:hypothetical protein